MGFRGKGGYDGFELDGFLVHVHKCLQIPLLKRGRDAFQERYLEGCTLVHFRSIPNISQIPFLPILPLLRYGNEQLYQGHTGRPLAAHVFIGPVYYQRLKHMVSDKIHSRAEGKKIKKNLIYN